MTDGWTTECEDRARILDSDFAKNAFNFQRIKHTFLITNAIDVLGLELTVSLKVLKNAKSCEE